MKLYVMRHGQTDWNVLRKVQGCSDTELNENGIKQAQNAKEKFEEYPIDVILCSPLKRTRKTIEIMNKDKKIPVIYEEKLLERSWGKIEGIQGEEADYFFNQHDYWNYHTNLKIKEIEPVVDCCQRVWEFIEEIKEKYAGKNVLCVTHRGIARVINSYFSGIGENGILPRTGFENCEIREFEL